MALTQAFIEGWNEGTEKQSLLVKGKLHKGDFRFATWRYLWKGRRQTGETPYWNAHREFKRRRFSDQLFSKWVEEPDRAKALYWRLHPTEELAMIKYWENLEAKFSETVSLETGGKGANE